MVTKQQHVLRNVCKGFIMQCGMNKVNEIHLKDLIEASVEVTKKHGIEVSYQDVKEGQVKSDELIQAILHCISGGYIHAIENTFNKPFYIYYRGEQAKNIFQRLNDNEQACAKDLFKEYSKRAGVKTKDHHVAKTGLNK